METKLQRFIFIAVPHRMEHKLQNCMQSGLEIPLYFKTIFMNRD